MLVRSLLNFSLIIGAAWMILPLIGRAQLTGEITGASYSNAVGLSLDLNTSAAFASFQTQGGNATDGYYPEGNIAPGTNTGVAETDTLNLADFSDLTGAQDNEQFGVGKISVTYVNATSTQIDNTGFIGTYNLTATITSSLFAPDEVYNFYIGTGNNSGTTTQDNITATLTDADGNTVGSYTYASEIPVPTSSNGSQFADLTLTIQGAAIGDTLSFSQSDPDITLVNFSSNEAVLTDAITADAAPEPSTWVLILSGVALLVGISYRRTTA